MNFEYAEQINPYLERLDMAGAIAFAEEELSRLPSSEFHDVIGISLVAQADDLAIWIDQFYQLVSERMDVEALYFEMNEFDINTDYWYIDFFAYSNDGGMNPDDMEWLVDYDASSQEETGAVFAIEGYEKLQRAFETFDSNYNKGQQDARDWCEQVIIARYMELVRAAQLSARTNDMGWAGIPIYFTEHEYDFIVVAPGV